jgi:ubiquinone/menaquinone biosynthesis C-methylase UbiE
MQAAPQVVSYEEARRFYDRFGRKQDSQWFYEDVATEKLFGHAALADAKFVVEFGCGTGRFAETILERHLPAGAAYLGIDVSSTKVDLARSRLARFGERMEVRQSNGDPKIDAETGRADRFISNYVFDLLSFEDIETVLREAQRILCPGSLLGVVSLSHGCTFASRSVERVWRAIYAVRPLWVGGCRPIELSGFVRSPEWQLRYCHRLAMFAVPSEVIVAEAMPMAERDAPSGS